MSVVEVIWRHGPGALQWHRLAGQVDHHYVTRCGRRFVIGPDQGIRGVGDHCQACFR